MINIKSPLPIVFICSVIVVAVLNMSTFISTYETTIESNNDKKVTLSKIESSYSTNISGKTNFLDLNGLFSRIVDKKELNGVYKIDNFIVNKNFVEGYANIENKINSMSEFNKYLKDRGIELLYVQAPYKVSPSGDELPAGITNDKNQVANELILGLKSNNVNTLDIRELMINENISFSDAFYSTDHHWTPQTAFWATNHILDKITELTNIKFDDFYNDIDNWEVKKTTEFYNGSEGVRVGYYYQGVEEAYSITPKFNTNYQVLESNKLPDVRDATYISRKNNLAYNSKKIMMIDDSFGNTVSSYIQMNFLETHLIDLRYMKNIYEPQIHETELFQIIDEVKPDIIVMLYFPYHILDENTFNVNPNNIEY